MKSTKRVELYIARQMLVAGGILFVQALHLLELGYESLALLCSGELLRTSLPLAAHHLFCAS